MTNNFFQVQTSLPDVIGPTGAIVSGHALASASGYAVLRQGGNAIDAGITAAAVMAVTLPHMNGIGGDTFMLIYNAKENEVYALNGSGRSGCAANQTDLTLKGLTGKLPDRGTLTVTVPGTPKAWSDALNRFGTMKWANVLQPAINYARHGFAVSHQLHQDISDTAVVLAHDPEATKLYLKHGQVLPFGSVLKQPDLANSLEILAKQGADAFYTGELAQQIASYLYQNGGFLTIEDLAQHESTWVDPIETNYHGYRVLTVPPNSQGLTLLQQLNIAKNFDLPSLGYGSADYIHTLLEIKKLAFADRDALIADPDFVHIPVKKLLSQTYAQRLAQRIQNQPLNLSNYLPFDNYGDSIGDTAYLTVVDGEGNAISLIQSLFWSFGAGIAVPNTGIVLHNRGSLFSLDPSHPNVIAPNKRPYHTLVPTMVLKNDSLFMSLGTPGGDGQTQTLMQVLNNILLFGMRPQAAVESPRWRSFDQGRLVIEPSFMSYAIQELRKRGHVIELREAKTKICGNAQIILVDPQTKCRIVGFDTRREAHAIAY